VIKILIIRFSSIGDIVLTSPIIRCLKQQLHNVEIDYLTKQEFAPLLIANPHISKVHILNKNFSTSIAHLKKENFNFIIDLHHNIRSLRIKLNLYSVPSFSFKKLNIEKWLLVHFKLNYLPRTHIVDRYFKTVEQLHVLNDLRGLDFFIPAKDNVAISTLPAIHQGGYIGFVIGAKHFTKRLPLEKIIAICKKQHQAIVLLGGKEDAAIGSLISNALGENCYNACGKYNLNQSASLIQQATSIISHDTGLMHIAAAFKKDITSVWGNTTPSFGMYPYLAGEHSKTIEVSNLNCRPCSKIGYPKCPKTHFKCMQDIDETLFKTSSNF